VRKLIIAGTTLILNFIVEVLVFLSLSIECVEMVFLLTYFLPLILFSPLIATMAYLIKIEELDLNEDIRTIIIKEIKNIPSSLFISVVSGLATLSIFFSPLLPLSIASNTIGGYDGIGALAEAYIRFKKNIGRFLKRNFLYFLFSNTLIIAWSMIYSSLSTELASILSASVSTLLLIVVIYRVLKEGLEYLAYGLKYCIYCETLNPIEAKYCRQCGFKLK